MDTEKMVKEAFGHALKPVLESSCFEDWFWDYMYDNDIMLTIVNTKEEEHFYDEVADIKKEIIEKTLDNLKKSGIIIM